MNKELISKLRKQAKVDPKEIVKALANTNDGKVVEYWLEQFAEQIVRECLNIVEPDVGMACGDEWYTALEGAAQEIKEHFGVEE